MKLNEVAVDVDRLEKGDWVNDIPDMQGVRFKVRGANNMDWRKLQSTLIDAVPRKHKAGGRITPQANDDIMTKLFVNCCLLDWDGLENNDGSPIPFSKEKALELLTNPELRRIRDGVAYAANTVADQNNADREEMVGNLVKLSSGSTDGELKKKAG
jgi:hypothetical protein